MKQLDGEKKRDRGAYKCPPADTDETCLAGKGGGRGSSFNGVIASNDTLPETFSGNFSPDYSIAVSLCYGVREERRRRRSRNSRIFVQTILHSPARSGKRWSLSDIAGNKRARYPRVLFRAKFALEKKREGWKKRNEEKKIRGITVNKIESNDSWRGEEEREGERSQSVGSEEIKVLTGLYRDFTAQYPTDAVRGLTSVDGRVDVVPVGLRSERQKVHGTVDQHLAYVRYREDRRLVPHEPINPRQRAALGRAMDHGPGLVREFNRGAWLRDQHRPLTVQHHSPPCNMDRATRPLL